tara:strand:- start:766 stop:1041 length:276 start_codon:yes stop_codon:yes gene_type:complete
MFADSVRLNPATVRGFASTFLCPHCQFFYIRLCVLDGALVRGSNTEPSHFRHFLFSCRAGLPKTIISDRPENTTKKDPSKAGVNKEDETLV